MSAIEQHTETPTRAAVVDLLRTEREWRRFFVTSSKSSVSRLWSGRYQLRDELQKRGEWNDPEEIGDVLLSLAREKLPGSPGAQWDAEWGSRLCRDALARLGERYAELSELERDRLDLEEQDEFHDRMNLAGKENDPAAFRLALAGWERAGVEAFDSVRSRKPVAS